MLTLAAREAIITLHAVVCTGLARPCVLAKVCACLTRNTFPILIDIQRRETLRTGLPITTFSAIFLTILARLRLSIVKLPLVTRKTLFRIFIQYKIRFTPETYARSIAIFAVGTALLAYSFDGVVESGAFASAALAISQESGESAFDACVFVGADFAIVGAFCAVACCFV